MFWRRWGFDVIVHTRINFQRGVFDVRTGLYGVAHNVGRSSDVATAVHQFDFVIDDLHSADVIDYDNHNHNHDHNHNYDNHDYVNHHDDAAAPVA